jgi:hypothetical protein
MPEVVFVSTLELKDGGATSWSNYDGPPTRSLPPSTPCRPSGRVRAGTRARKPRPSGRTRPSACIGLGLLWLRRAAK